MVKRFLALAGTLLALGAGGCTFVEGIAPAPTKDHFYVCENTYVLGITSASIVEYRLDESGQFVKVRVVR